jgi:coatomer subunit beta'
VNVYSYSLNQIVLEYQTAIVRGELDQAAALLPQIPSEHRNKVAQFLDGRNLKELALQVTTDLEHKFELTLQLGRLLGSDAEDGAYEIANKLESAAKWKAVGEQALLQWNVNLYSLALM